MRRAILLTFCATTAWSVFINDVQFVRTQDRRCPDTFLVLQARSAVHCCVTCVKNRSCRSVNFQSSTGSCELAPFHHSLSMVESKYESGWVLFSNTDVLAPDWTLVFKGCSGNGIDVYTSYVDGTNVITDDAMCIHGNVSACSKSNQHFRSTLLDSWNRLGITKVKYAMYKNDIEVAYIIFDGTGSSITDWFSLSRVVNTTWTGLWNIDLPWFSLEGYGVGRRIYINSEQVTCAADVTFTLAKTDWLKYCTFDNQPSYPTYLFSTGPNGGAPESMSGVCNNYTPANVNNIAKNCMDVADYVAFYIIM